ncbi:MAG: leucyl aminopeptidase family protein [Parachlamydiaceae bacterium]
MPLFKKGDIASHISSDLKKEIEKPLKLHDFTGEEGEIFLLYTKSGRSLLLGLGEKDKCSEESVRKAYGKLAKWCAKKKVKSVSLFKPNEFADSVLEGILFPNAKHLNEVHLIGKWDEKRLDELQTIFKGIYLARDLINEDADSLTPQKLAKEAKNLSSSKLKVKVLTAAQIKKEKLGLVLAVSRAANVDPAFIIIEYKGDPLRKDKTLLIGKGVTYDTGGLNLKQSGMEEMKSDMGGAAIVIGTMKVIADLKLKQNVIAIIPAVENAIGPGSFKLGSVYTSFSGKKVEVTNTDAEGRLILADAISYGIKHYKPTRIIDLATLTGAMTIILGHEGIGLFSNHDGLANTIEKAGLKTYERCFRLPLIEEYRELLKTEAADLKNWNGRMGASIISALFLKEFVENIPWAHLDIATVTFSQTARKYFPEYATGTGVRLLIETLKHL